MQLHTDWNQLQRDDVQIHIWNAGTSEENQRLMEGLGIDAFTIQGDPTLSLQRRFGLTEKEQQHEYALRGYVIIQRGRVVASNSVPQLAEMATLIMDQAAKYR